MSNVIEIIVDSKEFDMRFADGRKMFRKGAMNGLRQSGRHVRDRIKKFIKDPPKTGRKYPSLPNRSSAVGESPAYQTGNLSKSIKYVVSKWNEMEVGATERAKYAPFLEYNLRRPFASRAVSETLKTVEMMITMNINEALKI